VILARPLPVTAREKYGSWAEPKGCGIYSSTGVQTVRLCPVPSSGLLSKVLPFILVTREGKGAMPLIKGRTNRVRVVRHICRLQEPNRDMLVAYARFIGDTADYVLNQLIEGTLAKDREFLAWKADQLSSGEGAAQGDVAPTRERRSGVE
jgi:hypothetical protein